MNIQLYKTDSPTNYTNKSLNATKSYEINMLRDNDVLNPIIIIQVADNDVNSLNDSNYTIFNGRKYFITDITYTGHNRYMLSLKQDTLSTWWDRIKGTTAVVERSESNYNMYCNDNMFKTLNKQQVVTKVFPNSFNKDLSIILVTGGGNYGN